jgi:iron-sulfur cluster assembly protein
MLTVTEAAAQAINLLMIEHQMPEGSGLRIARQGETTRAEGLGVSIAAAPAEGDSVLDSNGAKVFLPANVINILQDQELDIERSNEDGEEKVNFIIDRKKMKPQE